MPLTQTQALQAVKDRGLIIVQVGNEWRAETRNRTRLGRDLKPTYEDAVEAAVAMLDAADQATVRADKSRLFDLLASGRVVFLSREIDVNVPGDPRPARAQVFDIKHASTGVDIVTAEPSLHSAVLKAEERGAFK